MNFLCRLFCSHAPLTPEPEQPEPEQPEILYKSYPIPIYELDNFAYEIKAESFYLELSKVNDDFKLCVKNEQGKIIVENVGDFMDVVSLCRSDLKKAGYRI